MPKRPTDQEIFKRFNGKRRMDIFLHPKSTFKPTEIRDGGYWLNGVEVDVEQLIKAYRKFEGDKTIVMGDPKPTSAQARSTMDF